MTVRRLFVIFIANLFIDLVSCTNNEKFYLYDWPDLVNRYANYTDRDHAHHGVEFPHWKLNHGAGRLIHQEYMEYKTSPYALFRIMYERALLDPR